MGVDHIVFLEESGDIAIVDVEADNETSMGEEIVVTDVVGVAVGTDDKVNIGGLDATLLESGEDTFTIFGEAGIDNTNLLRLDEGDGAVGFLSFETFVPNSVTWLENNHLSFGHELIVR